MIARTKALRIALIAAVAVTALTASQAQANKVTASGYPTTLRGIDLGTEPGKYMRISLGSRTIECASTTAVGTISGPTTTITVVPTYNKCFASGMTNVPVTATMNGCDYTVEASSKTTGRLTIDCPAGNKIEFHVYESAARHLSNTPLCTFDIGPQGPLGNVTLTTANTGTATEDLLVTLGGTGALATSTIGTAAICGASAGTSTKGSLSGSLTVTGESGGGAHVAVMIE